MHEASLMATLMRKLDEIAHAQGAKHIVGISVWLGALSHMSPVHLTEHFERASTGTMAEGARLEIAVSEDVHDINAYEILIKRVEVEV